MRVFRRHSAGATDGTAQDSPGARSPDAPADSKPARSPAEAAKGRPTPKRSEAQAKGRQPITKSRAPAAPRTPQDKAKARSTRATKYAAMKRGEAWGRHPRGRRPTPAPAPPAPRPPQDKAKARSTRATKYAAMKRGEAWALNPRDRGPTRALARDFVDSKRRISEYYMYVLVILLVAVFLRNKTESAIISPLVLVLVVVVLADAMLIRRSLTKLIAERLPGESARGLTLYAVMRALQIRRFRMPAPRVQPGQKP